MRLAIIYILISQLCLPYSLVANATEPQTRSVDPYSEQRPVNPFTRGTEPDAGKGYRRGALIEPAVAHPFIDTLQHMKPIPLTLGIAPSDPSVDDDPFFLRSQKWGELKHAPATDTEAVETANAPEVAFDADAKGFRVWLAGTQKIWQVAAPLHPVYFTGEYLVLAANDPAYFEKNISDGLAGEGVFLISYNELLAGSFESDRIPIYFFPLPGGNWAGKIRVESFPSQELTVVVDSKGETIPLQNTDIETVVSAAKLNLMFAMGAALHSLAKNNKTLEDTKGVTPPRGSTAGFGMLFTGFNLDYPAHNRIPHLKATTGWIKNVEQMIGYLTIRSAHAAGEEAKPQPAASEEEDKPGPSQASIDATANLIDNLMRVGVVLVVCATAAVVLKYTVYRRHFNERYGNEVRGGAFTRAGRQLRGVGDVFAHNLTLLSNIAPVWFGNGVEFIIDRHFPQLGAAENSLVRRFLNKTVYFSRNAGSNLAVNYWTLIQGTFVLGGIDVLMVAGQYYIVTPELAHFVKGQVPALESRIDNAFKLDNPDTEIYKRNRVIDNVAGYLTTGASTLSVDLRSQLVAQLEPEVDAEMRREGLDPHGPNNQTIRKERLEKRLLEIGKKLGLPGQEDFLFDAASLWGHVMGVFGYTHPDQLTGEARGPPLIGEMRPGLLSPALNNALKEAERRLLEHPSDPSLSDAVKILRATSRDASKLWAFLRYPLRVFMANLQGRLGVGSELVDLVKTLRRARQSLLVLTREGDIKAELSDLPGGWLKLAGEPGARIAGELVRRSFFSLLTGERSALTGPTDAQRNEYRVERAGVEAAALVEMRARYPQENAELRLRSPEEADTLLRQTRRGELEMLVDFASRERMSTTVAEMVTYEPPAKGWYRIGQERRAKNRSQKKYILEHRKIFDAEAATPAEITTWNETYAAEMMRAVGVYPDYSAEEGLRERVESSARRTTETQKNEPYIKRFLDTLTAQRRVDFEASLYAENVTKAYIEITTASTSIPAISPAMPGRLQWLRQTRMVRGSTVLTRLCRTYESMMPEVAHRAGLTAAVQRNVPVVYDFVMGNMRVYRGAVTGAIAVYWFNYGVWGFGLPAKLWMLQVFSAFMIATPSQVLTRFFRMQGWQPMGKIRSMALYAFIYSWATFGGQFPALTFRADFVGFIDAVTNVVTRATEPIWRTVSQVLSPVCELVLRSLQ